MKQIITALSGYNHHEKRFLAAVHADLLFLWTLVPTAWEGELALLAEELAPMMQGAVGYAQISRYVGERFRARLH